MHAGRHDRECKLVRGWSGDRKDFTCRAPSIRAVSQLAVWWERRNLLSAGRTAAPCGSALNWKLQPHVIRFDLSPQPFDFVKP